MNNNNKKKERSENLVQEVKHLWSMKKVDVIPFVLRALGADSQGIKNFIQE